MSDKLEGINAKYNKTRGEISQEIRENIEKMSSMSGLKEVQVIMLSMRQRLLEDNHILIEQVEMRCRDMNFLIPMQCLARHSGG